MISPFFSDSFVFTCSCKVDRIEVTRARAESVAKRSLDD